PHVSTRFPYTPLFRSEREAVALAALVLRDRDVVHEQVRDEGEVRVGVGGGAPRLDRHLEVALVDVDRGLLVVESAGRDGDAEGGDRKSTRLNSSHVKI